jgi:hypothetical protein
LRIKTMPIESSSCRLLSNTSWKKLVMPSHSFNKCRLIVLNLWLLRAA